MENKALGTIFKGMLTLLIGAGLGRLIGIISIPIITRFYTPSDYGVLGLYVSFIAVLSPLFSMRYVQAIPLPKSDAVALNIVSLCLKSILFWFFSLSILFYFFSSFILGIFNADSLKPWWWMIIVGAAGVSLYELLSLWATRKKNFSSMSKSQISQSIIGNLVKIILGYFSFNAIGLIIGQFLNQSMGVIGLVYSAKKDLIKNKHNIKIKYEKFVAVYYRQFLFYRLPSQLLMALSIQAPLFISALLFDKSITGQLNLAIMILSLPVSLISQAMARAFYSEIASIGKNNLKTINSLTIQLQKKLFLIGFPFAIIVYFIAEPLFKLFFGTEWTLAGQYAAILSPFIVFQFTSSPLMEVINVLGKQHYFLILHLVRFLGLACIYYILKLFMCDNVTFVITISLYLSFFYLSASILVINTLRKEIKST